MAGTNTRQAGSLTAQQKCLASPSSVIQVWDWLFHITAVAELETKVMTEKLWSELSSDRKVVTGTEVVKETNVVVVGTELVTEMW